jgi:hypothetical protein
MQRLGARSKLPLLHLKYAESLLIGQMKGQSTLDAATDGDMTEKRHRFFLMFHLLHKGENKSLKPTVNSRLGSSFDASKRFKAFNNY